MEGAYIILGGGLLFMLVLISIVIWQLHRSGEFSKPKSRNHYIGLGISLGMAIGIPLGLLYGITADNIAVGVSLGPGLGAGIGIALGAGLEKKFNPHPLSGDDVQIFSRKRLAIGVIAGLGMLVLLILTAILVLK